MSARINQLVVTTSQQEFPFIRYAYLETASRSPSAQAAISHLVGSWQRLGHLVVREAHIPGLWLFEEGFGISPISLPSSATRTGSRVTADGVELVLKHTGSYDFSALLSSWRGTPGGSSDTPVSKDVLHAHFISAQANAINKQAMSANAAVDLRGGHYTDDRNSAKESPGATSIPARIVHERFLTAVMSSISYLLAATKGYLPLGSRTLVLPTTVEDDNNSVDLITLSADYTGGKVLVVKATTSATQGLKPVSGIEGSAYSVPMDAIVMLSPCGIFAKFKGTSPVHSSLHDGQEKSDQDPNSSSTQVNESPGSASWRKCLLVWLSGKGLATEALQHQPWVRVGISLNHSDTKLDRSHASIVDGVVSDQQVIVPWPARLCFGRALQCDPVGTSSVQEPYDLLDLAHKWLQGEGERMATQQKRKCERELAEDSKKSQTEAAYDTQMTSPLAMRRSSLAGIVYPTPPDGIQTNLAPTPAHEGSASTPGAVDMRNTGDFKSEDTQGDIRQALRDDTGEHDFTYTTNGTHIFGDTGDDDLFGDDNGVTDADFSFFDAPNAFLQDNTSTVSPDEAADLSRTRVVHAESTLPSPVEMATDEEQVDDVMDELPVGASSIQAGINTLQTENSINFEGTSQALNRHIFAPLKADKDSPPLRPETVFRRLSSLKTTDEANLVHENQWLRGPEACRTASAFRQVDFNPSIASFEEKYGPNGRFIYPPLPETSPPSSSRKPLPTTSYLARHRRRKLAANMEAYCAKIEGAAVHDHDWHLSMQPDLANSKPRSKPMTTFSIDNSTDEDVSSDSADHVHKRKRDTDSNGESDGDEDLVSASLQDLCVNKDEFQEDQHLIGIEMSQLDADPAQWSLARYLSWPDSWTSDPILTDIDFVAAAQILANQASSRTFTYTKSFHDANMAERSRQSYSSQLVQSDFLEAAQQLFRGASTCSLASFLDIQGMALPAASMARLPQRLTQNSSGTQVTGTTKSSIFEIPVPHLELRRSDSKLSVLPAAIDFWEVLGLAPRGNSKNITSVCVYSASMTSAAAVDLFLENMEGAFETCRLGGHSRLNVDGLAYSSVAYRLDQAARFSSDRWMSTIKSALAEVFCAISRSGDSNFVIYFPYDPTKPELLPGVCANFSQIRRTYLLNGARATQMPAAQVVLQLIPFNLISTSTHLVINAPGESMSLALEVYDRFSNPETGRSSPSIAIESPLPRGIEFKLTPNPSASVLEENSCLHIAYAQSIDDRWISVAWTDNSGIEQHTASYNLSRKGKPFRRHFQEVAHEIWETTLDLMADKKVHWRLMIAKTGTIEPQDVQFWRDLASTESTAQISVTLLTVDATPSLQLIAPDIALPASPMTEKMSVSATPVSTPQGTSVLSPDSNVVSTPADPPTDVKLEPDATLFKISEQMFGGIQAHRNNNANCPTDVRPTMISGYLIKRGESVPKLMEVNIIWTEMSPRTMESFLREIMAWYASLATLASARALVDAAEDPRPWHVVMVERAVKALYVLM